MSSPKLVDMFHTTLNLLKINGAFGCDKSYDKLRTYLGKGWEKNTPIPLTTVLDSNGLDDALWCLRAVMPEEETRRDRDARHLACEYAEGENGSVLALYEAECPGDLRVRHCIETARRFALGQATREELAVARADAWDAAAWAASGAACSAWAASGAAWDAWSAAWYARAGQSFRHLFLARPGFSLMDAKEWQRERLVAMLEREEPA